jgi:hypothetical protein
MKLNGWVNMIYEIKRHRLGTKKAECIFCKKPVNLGDYAYLCKEHGTKYYGIPKVLRVIFPKVIIYLVFNLTSRGYAESIKL